MHEILLSAQRLPEPERRRVFTQMAILSGLRGSAERFRMELTAMGVYIEIEDNVILKDIHDAGVAQGRNEGWSEGRNEGRAEGQAEGAANVLRGLLEDRFGPIPAWAESRIAGAGPSELTRWARRVYSAPDVESALERH